MRNIHEEGFILPFWNAIFGFLEKLSIFYLLRKKIAFTRTYLFVELWVFGNLMMSIVLSYIIHSTYWRDLAYGIVIYGLSRVFEVVIYQINVLLFHPYRKALKGETYFIKSPTRMVVLRIEMVAGLIMTLISLGRFIGTLPPVIKQED